MSCFHFSPFLSECQGMATVILCHPWTPPLVLFIL